MTGIPHKKGICVESESVYPENDSVDYKDFGVNGKRKSWSCIKGPDATFRNIDSKVLENTAEWCQHASSQVVVMDFSIQPQKALQIPLSGKSIPNQERLVALGCVSHVKIAMEENANLSHSKWNKAGENLLEFLCKTVTELSL